MSHLRQSIEVSNTELIPSECFSLFIFLTSSLLLAFKVLSCLIRCVASIFVGYPIWIIKSLDPRLSITLCQFQSEFYVVASFDFRHIFAVAMLLDIEFDFYDLILAEKIGLAQVSKF